MVSASVRSARRWSDWRVIAVVVIAIVIVLAWLTRASWLQAIAGSVSPDSADNVAELSPSDDSAEHDHGAATVNSITLSDRGLANIGFRPATVELQSFERTVTVPAIVAEKPGQTQIHLSSPVGGILTGIYVIQGEAIQPGSKMFDVRLTHEELVTAQQDYLKIAESLEVVNREIERLQSIGQGVVAGKRILEQQYEKQKLDASLRAAEQALLVHGMTEEQVAEILKTRQLLRSISVYAPEHSHAGDGCPEEHTFHVQRLPVSLGQQVETSQELAVLADHCELYIEGRAFEDDASRLREATREGWDVSAKLLTEEREETRIDDLKLLYLADTIDPESRAFHFYLKLPNAIVLDQTDAEKHRFIEWRFKPGQRLELRVPVERWEERIVLPIDAVVDEGAESYVYRQNGESFERVAVKVDYRDGDSAVIGNDGALFPGDIVAGRGAYQMHLALKNQAGGGVDPHAGHNH
jgi:cobalt-zinc-cadmium efflux system membrane fusion protein